MRAIDTPWGRFQFSQNLALTPSLQWLVDPALNPDDDQVRVFGLRRRVSFVDSGTKRVHDQ